MVLDGFGSIYSVLRLVLGATGSARGSTGYYLIVIGHYKP